MITPKQQEPARMPAFRISDSETMQNKLMYQIRSGNLNEDAMNRLQTQCTEELHQLRSELDVMLQELREIADRLNGRTIQESIAA
ncbi:hypothetical protein DFQ01_10829 [Paenibacillus cellulosilyticus]|uniref:Uncharacterized protein n=1 Tax=Paenibacillus cellulosilyticus TaxID=375489 RepID=A0A2V2YTF4_9BACL|nr:hypothetical protein [Paenibacillus cellulosilyticus]PWW02753.1 hypothetical protein DFQ01_10829 [Paenibacillus cellulosilyticus]QKS45676.1 hypothetical protein HUB94_15475 [Paenibacillus cellulosilyticus]